MIADTGISGTAVTVTNTNSKIFEPSVLDTVILTEPGAIAVMKPFDPVATSKLLEDQTIA